MMNMKLLSVVTPPSIYQGYTIQDRNIRWDHQFCWCVSLLCYNVHADIFHGEHLWYLRGIFHWLMHFMSTGCREGTNFHQFQPTLHQPVWYYPRALFWNYPSSQYCWWVQFMGPLVLRFGRTWGQEMVVFPIPQWVIPSRDCTKRLLHSPMLSGLLHQGACWNIYPDLYSWIPLHPLWYWLELGSHCSHNNDLFLHIHCKWCDPYFSWVSTPSLFRRLRHPQLSRFTQTWAGWWPCWIVTFYQSHNYIYILIGDSVLRSPSLGILPCSAQSHFQHAFKGRKTWFCLSSPGI